MQTHNTVDFWMQQHLLVLTSDDMSLADLTGGTIDDVPIFAAALAARR